MNQAKNRAVKRTFELRFHSYLDALELIRLESPDFVRFLLDNLGLVQRLYCHYFIFNTQSLTQPSFKAFFDFFRQILMLAFLPSPSN